jgi:dTDP-glucose 4,6-dehydratase
VTDHCTGIDAVLRRGRTAEVYNVGGHGERTNLDVARHVCREVDALVPAGAPHERLVTFVADRPGHDFRYALDATKIEGELGWRATVPFARGIHATVAAAVASFTPPRADP